MIQKYCYECATQLIEKESKDEGIVPFCPECEQYRFPMYNVAVSMIIIDEKNDNILLIKQYGKPFYVLVAGYVNRGETQEEAVLREIKEETGLDVSRMVFNKTSFFEPSNTLMCNYTVFVKNASLLKPNYEIDSYAWFTSDKARQNIKHDSIASEFLIGYLDGGN